MEILKEKIMKLEQRNIELERKLITSSSNPNTSSKENSFNESFNFNNEDSIARSFPGQSRDQDRGGPQGGSFARYTGQSVDLRKQRIIGMQHGGRSNAHRSAR